MIFDAGFLPVPYLMDALRKYPRATKWSTAIRNGGIRVIDEYGNIIRTIDRYKKIFQSV